MKFYGNLLILISFLSISGCNTFEGENSNGFSSNNPLMKFFSWTPQRTPLVSAYRGGPSAGFPENCIPTFSNTLSNVEAIIECDVALTKDSILILMYGDSLDRTTSGTGKIIDHTYEEIRNLKLVDNFQNKTFYRIPTLAEALDWARERAILQVNVQDNVPFDKVNELIEEMNAISYVIIGIVDIDNLKHVYQTNPDLLVFTSIQKKSDFSKLSATSVPFRNVLAFTGHEIGSFQLNSVLHQHMMYCMARTVDGLDSKAGIKGYKVYFPLLASGIDIISTDRPIEVSKAITEYRRLNGMNAEIKETSHTELIQ